MCSPHGCGGAFSASGTSGSCGSGGRAGQHGGGLLPFTLIPLALIYPAAPWWLFGAYFAAGVGLEPLLVYWQVAMQREIPRDRLARVVSLDWMASVALMPLGLALTGPAVSAVGEAAVLWATVVVASVPTLFVLAVPGLSAFRTPAASAQVVSAASAGPARSAAGGPPAKVPPGP